MKMVICIPSGITEVEKRAVFDSADHVDSKETYLIHEPMAAALGIGLDVEEPIGNMIIDIGGGTTEIAVIALSGIVCDQSIRIAGDELTSDITNYMKRQHNILIGERTSEQIKIHVGSALPELENPPADYAVNGRDLMTGIPKQILVSYQEIAHALDKSILKIEEAVSKAAKLRLRPILMTAVSTILGLLPIALALGVGTESRQSLGVVIIFGMTIH